MEQDCSQWERLAGEFAEVEKFYQAANQYEQAAACYLDRVEEMTRNSAENYHIYAEASLEKDDHRSAAQGYFEAATQYRQISEHDTALTLYENAAKEALLERMTETAAQAYLWAAFACHKLGNKEYFLTCAKNMGNLYKKAAKKALDEGKAERAVIDLSLAAMGFATIERMDEAREEIKKARRIIDKTRWVWLKTLLSFSEALTENNLDKADELLEDFEEEETIQEVMGACLNIREEIERRRRREQLSS
jgi:tetratricopeptide (TPR) repeat protein